MELDKIIWGLLEQGFDTLDRIEYDTYTKYVASKPSVTDRGNRIILELCVDPAMKILNLRTYDEAGLLREEGGDCDVSVQGWQVSVQCKGRNTL